MEHVLLNKSLRCAMHNVCGAWALSWSLGYDWLSSICNSCMSQNHPLMTVTVVRGICFDLCLDLCCWTAICPGYQMAGNSSLSFGQCQPHFLDWREGVYQREVVHCWLRTAEPYCLFFFRFSLLKASNSSCPDAVLSYTSRKPPLSLARSRLSASFCLR